MELNYNSTSLQLSRVASPDSLPIMSRPLSMPDFSALADTSAPLFEKRIHSRRQTSPERRSGHIRKMHSVSLAAGLIMNAEQSKDTSSFSSPPQQSRVESLSEGIRGKDGSENLFYAYCLRTDYPDSPPYILTFASATVCSQWWALVQEEFPESNRPSPQFFVVRSEHMELMRDDSKFFELRTKWFYTSQDSPTCPPTVIPLQSPNGQPAASIQSSLVSLSAQTPQPPQLIKSTSEERPISAAINSLTEALGQLATVVATNAEQIHALSVAQSAGLQHMQEINESNSTQIKAIAESQLKLHSLVDQNAAHYIALANSSFQSHEETRQSQEQTRKSQRQIEKSQEQTRDVLKSTMSQVQGFASSQTQLARTCEGMMRSIETLSNSVAQMHTAMSDTTSQPFEMHSAMAARISPAPRKLNRRIKGVWYEYDSPISPHSTPRRRVDSVNTPPKSPVNFKNMT
ncbi:hypothetical protein ACN47E_004230 [Coniothyrium glycines]